MHRHLHLSLTHLRPFAALPRIIKPVIHEIERQARPPSRNRPLVLADYKLAQGPWSLLRPLDIHV